MPTKGETKPAPAAGQQWFAVAVKRPYTLLTHPTEAGKFQRRYDDTGKLGCMPWSPAEVLRDDYLGGSPPPVGTGGGAWAVGQRRRGQILGVAKPCCKSDETAFEVLGPDQRDWYVRCEACGEQWSFSEDWPNVLVDYGTARAATNGSEQPKALPPSPPPPEAPRGRPCRPGISRYHGECSKGTPRAACKRVSDDGKPNPIMVCSCECHPDHAETPAWERPVTPATPPPPAPQTAHAILQAREAARAAKRAEDARAVAGFVDFFDLLRDA